jgi:O-antigen ligase
MAGTPLRSSLDDARARANAVWLIAATTLSVGGARLAVAMPVWGWVTGALAAGAAAALWASPMFATLGLVAGKQVMPQNSALIVGATAIGLFALARGAWRRLPPAPAAFFAAFVLLALPTVKTTLAPWETIQVFTFPGTDWEVFPFRTYEIRAALGLVAIGSLAAAVAFAVRSRDDIERLLGAFTLGAAYPILIGLRDRAMGIVSYHDGTPSIASTFGHPNAYATYLCAVAPILIGIAFSARSQWLRRGAGLVALLAVISIVLTFTRSAWFALILAAVVSALVAGKVRHLLGVAAVAMVLATATGYSSEITGRLSDVHITTETTGAKGDSWQWRLLTWNRMWNAYPTTGLTGFGYGAYPRYTVEVFGRYGGDVNTNLSSTWRKGFGAHNDFLSALLQMGVPGLLTWCGFMFSLGGSAFSLYRKSRDPVVLGTFGSVVALVFMSISDNVQAYDYGWFLVAGMFTAYFAVLRRPTDPELT